MLPIRAHSRCEAEFYLKVVPCQRCGQGPLATASERRLPQPGEPVGMVARCVHCQAEHEFAFTWPDEADETAGQINTTSEPSEIIDAGQWLALHNLLTELANRTSVKPVKRLMTFQAGECLDEALKFYTEATEDLPPTSAFFTESSRKAFAEHPEKFLRLRLQDMRRKFPKHPPGPRGKDRGGKRKWWQLW